MMRLLLAVALLAACASASVDGRKGGVVELGDSAGVAVAAQQTYKHYLTQALTVMGVSSKEVDGLTEKHELGESSASPKDDDTEQIRQKAMVTAIKILELENQKKKLVTENTMNADSVPTFPIAQKLMKRKDYTSYRTGKGDMKVEKNNNYLEKERIRLKKLMEADFHGKYKAELERGLASMMNKMEENAEETPQAEAPEDEEDDATADGAKQEKMKKLKDTIAREKGVLDELKSVKDKKVAAG